MKPLPQFLQDLIAAVPQSGSGVHAWLYKVSRQLHAHRDTEDIIALLTAAADGCGRHVPEREIRAAVEDAKATAWEPKGSGPRDISRPVPKWPGVDEQAVANILSAPTSLNDLRESSPTSCNSEVDAEWYADELFPGNPLLCVGADNSKFGTAPREAFRGKLSKLTLIVPSPMSALTGHTKSEGKESAHTLENTGPRKYLVTEFDSGSRDEQTTIITHLAAFAPLVMVLSSAGKSLHAWWHACDESRLSTFFRYAVSLGADPATWTRSQFVRLPEGWRTDKRARQSVYYFQRPNQ